MPLRRQIRRIVVQSQPRQITCKTLSWKKSITKNGWWSSSRCRPWVQAPVLKKKGRKEGRKGGRKVGRKERKNTENSARKEGKKEGRKERTQRAQPGRKERRKEGRKEGRKERKKERMNERTQRAQPEGYQSGPSEKWQWLGTEWQRW
jgi:hypothetical protein